MIVRESPSGPPKGANMLQKLWWARTHPPADPNASFEGKTVLVTGANSGLGFQAALKFVVKGASRLLMGVRSLEKGEVAKQEILRRTGRNTDCITLLQVDLSDFGSVESFVRAVEAETEGHNLDIVLLSAGLANPTFELSSHGWEQALQVDVLSTGLMALLLLPKLLSNTQKPTHLSFINSISHTDVQREWFGDSLLEATNRMEKYDPTKSYGMVKLLGICVMQSIARVVSNTDIIVNASCPFMCRTGLRRNWPLIQRIPMTVIQLLFARSAEQGSRTLVGATTLGRESHGRFWHHDTIYPLGELAYDDRLMQKSWGEILKVYDIPQF